MATARAPGAQRTARAAARAQTMEGGGQTRDWRAVAWCTMRDILSSRHMARRLTEPTSRRRCRFSPGDPSSAYDPRPHRSNDRADDRAEVEVPAAVGERAADGEVVGSSTWWVPSDDLAPRRDHVR